MAKAGKKKLAFGGGDEENAADALIKALETKYGGGIVREGSEVSQETPKIFSVSPSLDLALGGGICEGSLVSIVGPEKIGKTVTALTFCAEVQKETNGSRHIFYFDVECRLKSRDLKGIKGLDPDKNFHVIRSTKEKILSTIDYLTIAEDILKGVPNCVIVFDSISAMCNPSVIEDGVGKADYGSNNKYVGQFCDICAPIVKLNNSIVIGIVHVYANVGAQNGPAVKEKGAGRWRYQVDYSILGKYTQPWRVGTDDKSPQIGLILHWQIKTSGLGPPGNKCESYIRFNLGIDKTYELLNMAKDLQLMTVAGSWMTLDFVTPDMTAGTDFEDKPVKLQGLEKCYRLLEEKPEWASRLNEKIKEMLS